MLEGPKEKRLFSVMFIYRRSREMKNVLILSEMCDKNWNGKSELNRTTRKGESYTSRRSKKKMSPYHRVTYLNGIKSLGDDYLCPTKISKRQL